MALQYWYAQGSDQKTKLLTVNNGYFGDTFGGMAVCDPVNGMHEMFTDVLAQHIFADAPASRSEGEWDNSYIADLEKKTKR